MVYFLNRGFIAEQAIAALIESYFENLDGDVLYENFHISVTNDHPFAHMLIDNNFRSQDTFPSVIVTTQTDYKTSELENLPVESYAISLKQSDIENIINVWETVEINGKKKRKKIAGVCSVASDTTISNLKEIIKNCGEVFGLSRRARRTDSISIEIWADNVQLKNELYELLRLYLTTTFPLLLYEKYKNYAVSVRDGSVRGERSNNFNFDFDVPLAGANITFEIDYAVEQILIDTEIKEFNRDIVVEVCNHVKK